MNRASRANDGLAISKGGYSSDVSLCRTILSHDDMLQSAGERRLGTNKEKEPTKVSVHCPLLASRLSRPDY